jgi:hypothetical protein
LALVDCRSRVEQGASGRLGPKDIMKKPLRDGRLFHFQHERPPLASPCLNSRRMECVPNGYNDRVKFFERKIGKQGENEYGAYRLKGVKLHLKKKPGVARRRI